MSETERPDAGWRPHPTAGDSEQPQGSVAPARIVEIGALCDLERQARPDPRSQSFSVEEFVTLEDGRRVTLHSDRGFTIGLGTRGEQYQDLRRHESVDSVTQNVLNVVLPDDDELALAEQHPWALLADLARERGLDATAEDLRQLPYRVILSDQVTRWLDC